MIDSFSSFIIHLLCPSPKEWMSLRAGPALSIAFPRGPQHQILGLYSINTWEMHGGMDLGFLSPEHYRETIKKNAHFNW